MRWYQWLGLAIVGAAFIFLATMAVHNANAAEEEAQPKWKIVVTLDGPPGKQTLTYGTPQTGAVWFKDRDECEKARKGGDKKFATGMAQLQAQLKQQRVPIEVTAACVPDNSI